MRWSRAGGRFAEALKTFERGVVVERAEGMRAEEAVTLYQSGDLAAAAEVARECLAISTEIGYRLNIERTQSLLDNLSSSYKKNA